MVFELLAVGGAELDAGGFAAPHRLNGEGWVRARSRERGRRGNLVISCGQNKKKTMDINKILQTRCLIQDPI